MKKGWTTKNLGDLCRIRTGKKDVNQGNPNGDFPFFTCAAEHTFSDSYSFDTEALLIAGNGDVGKVSYYKGKFEAYQRTYVLSDFTEVSPRFLYLILDGKLRDTVSKQKLGNTMPYIKVGMLTDFQLPVPPLPEQRRIVSILDEAFAGLATAKANAEKNLHNARALFESHLQSVFSLRGKGWVEKKISDLSDYITVGFVGTMAHLFVDEGIPLLRGQNIRAHGIDFSNLKFISKETHAKWKKSALRAGDVAIVRVGYPGTAAVVPEGAPELNAASLVIVRPDQQQLDSYFLAHALNSEWGKCAIKARLVGAAQQVFNTGTAADLQIPLPPLAEQKALVCHFDTLHEETTRLAAIYQQKLAALEALKKSLLHRAFSGEL